jgi:hypothetical protein
MDEVRRFLVSLTPLVRSGKVRAITYKDSEPPSREGTIWKDDRTVY